MDKLIQWRNRQAEVEGVPGYRVLPNEVLENIAEMKPLQKNDLLAIKGIKEKKYAKYGPKILFLVSQNESGSNQEADDLQKPIAVSAYLDSLNRSLSDCWVRVQGEVSSVDVREKVIYFSLKDPVDESVIRCLVWRTNYELSGVKLEPGLEVVLEGTPEIYKPLGRLSFKAGSIELVGEGVLKKAYEQLKEKLESEGLLAVERKRQIPELCTKVGLITSETGAVIHDFLTNLDKFGFQVKLFGSRVEGQSAVRDLMFAVDNLARQDIEVLVIIRGGGSFESLQAFNNEALIRKIASFPKPVICGIGHEKDVPLASLVADKMTSTPTAAAGVLNRGWQETRDQFLFSGRRMVSVFDRSLMAQEKVVTRGLHYIQDRLNILSDDFYYTKQAFCGLPEKIRFRILELTKDLDLCSSKLIRVSDRVRIEVTNDLLTCATKLSERFDQEVRRVSQVIDHSEKVLEKENPERLLKKGYSIARFQGQVVRSVRQLKTKDRVEIMVRDGSFGSQVDEIKKLD